MAMAAAHSLNRFDALWRSILLTKFFVDGWGRPDALRRMIEFRANVASRERCLKLFDASIDKVTVTGEKRDKGIKVISGCFRSPIARHAPEWIPPPVDQASFQMVQPEHIERFAMRPLVVHMAGTGDFGFARRRLFMAEPLAKEYGITSIILENPFYGTRKPKRQTRSALLHVTDLFVMGGALMTECLVLLHWAREREFAPLGLTGISLGGHMASLGATVWPEPVSLVPCLSWSTASQVFTEGVLSYALPWELLEEQFFKHNYGELIQLKAITNSEAASEVDKQHAYDAGAQFAKSYTSALSKVMSNALPSGSKRPTRPEVREFMRGVMDEFTHMSNFDRPVDPSLVISVQATEDGYVPRNNVRDLRSIWGDEVEVRYVEAGHVTAILGHHPKFRIAIRDALQKHARKHYGKDIC